jgi:hypothetical protein
MVWQRRFWQFNAPLSEESHRVFAEHLLNNKQQMSAFGATEGLVTQTKQMKIGLCEQVRVDWKTGVYATNASIIVTSEIGDETPGAALNAHSQNEGRLPGSMSEMKPSKERRQRLGEKRCRGRNREGSRHPATGADPWPKITGDRNPKKISGVTTPRHGTRLFKRPRLRNAES